MIVAATHSQSTPTAIGPAALDADDLLEVGVDGGVSAESLQRYDGRHHCQPTAQLAQHRQPLVQRQVLQRRPTSH